MSEKNQAAKLAKKYEEMAVDHEAAEERTSAGGSYERDDNNENVNSLPIPTKIILVCLALFIGGGVLFTIGLMGVLGEESELGRDVSLLILGTILLIPGLYYSYLLGVAFLAKTRSERQQILNEFPLDYYE